jgi:hypothetical protein
MNTQSGPETLVWLCERERVTARGRTPGPYQVR